jgi:hypothetical protein
LLSFSPAVLDINTVLYAQMVDVQQVVQSAVVKIKNNYLLKWETFLVNVGHHH